jgi:hypothetical protein
MNDTTNEKRLVGIFGAALFALVVWLTYGESQEDLEMLIRAFETTLRITAMVGLLVILVLTCLFTAKLVCRALKE